jgi:hypothetical protein
MTEDLVLIRTYQSDNEAAEAQAELLAAGIHSLLVTEDGPIPAPQLPQAIGLAVHRRDAEIASAVLGSNPKPA